MLIIEFGSGMDSSSRSHSS